MRRKTPRLRVVQPAPFDMARLLDCMSYHRLADEQGQTIPNLWEDELFLRRIKREGDELVMDWGTLGDGDLETEVAEHHGGHILHMPQDDPTYFSPLTMEDMDDWDVTIVRFRQRSKPSVSRRKATPRAGRPPATLTTWAGWQPGDRR
jgi:hypothetical protein